MNSSEKIPKVVHYCWFGRGEKPRKLQKCIKSWHKHLPEFQFVEWNEDNFDVTVNRYVQEAYEQRKYAFVSDYARLHALYSQGGIYMDTDVEVIRPLDRFLELEAFPDSRMGIFCNPARWGRSPGIPGSRNFWIITKPGAFFCRTARPIRQRTPR